MLHGCSQDVISTEAEGQRWRQVATRGGSYGGKGAHGKCGSASLCGSLGAELPARVQRREPPVGLLSFWASKGNLKFANFSVFC